MGKQSNIFQQGAFEWSVLHIQGELHILHEEDEQSPLWPNPRLTGTSRAVLGHWSRFGEIQCLAENELQSNLDHPDSLGPHEIVRIIEGPDNRKYEY